MRLFFLFLFCFNVAYSQQNDSISYQLRKKKLIGVGLKAFRKNDTFVLNKTTNQLLRFYERRQDSFALAKYFHFRALHHKISYMSDSVYYYYNESKNISKHLNDSLEVGRRLLGIAVLQRTTRDLVGSEISSIEALRYLEPIGDSNVKTVYNNLGLVSEQMNQIRNALDYYNKSLSFEDLKTNVYSKESIFVYNNIGLLYVHLEDFEKAQVYFRKGLSLEGIKERYPHQYALLLENLAFCDFSLKKLSNVLENYNEVLKIRSNLRDNHGLSVTQVLIALYYKEINQLGKARNHAKLALQLSKKSHNNQRWLEALELLSELTSGNEAKEHFKEYISLSDSLLQQERGLKNQFARIRFETGKKEKENAFLKSENQRNQDEIVRHKQQKIIGWLAALLAFVGLGFTITVFVFRRRKLLFQAQLQKAEAREQERKQIAKALHDEVAGDLRLLHRKLEKSNLLEEATKLNAVKDNVRNLSHQLSSVSFKKVGFKDQIINLVSDYFEMDFRIFVKGINDYDWEEVDSAIKRLLYICLRETVQNSKNHAEASKVEVTFSIHKKNVLLNVADNGVGFDTSSSKKGIGLQNLQERVEELQGSFAITSERGTGTETHIQIPLNV